MSRITFEGSFIEPEPTKVYSCLECGDAIYEGDYYYEFDNGCVCERCMEDHRHIAYKE